MKHYKKAGVIFVVMVLLPVALRAQQPLAAFKKYPQVQPNGKNIVVPDLKKNVLQMILAAQTRVALQKKNLEAQLLQALIDGNFQEAANLKEQLAARGLLTTYKMLPFHACLAQEGEEHAGQYVIYGEQGEVRQVVTREKFEEQYMPVPEMGEEYFVPKAPRAVVQLPEEAARQLQLPFALEAGDYLDITDMDNMGCFSEDMFLILRHTPVQKSATGQGTHVVRIDTFNNQTLVDALTFPAKTLSLELSMPAVSGLRSPQPNETIFDVESLETPKVYHNIDLRSNFRNSGSFVLGNNGKKMDSSRRQMVGMQPRTIVELGISTGFVTSNRTLKGTVSLSGKLLVLGWKHMQHFARKVNPANAPAREDMAYTSPLEK